MVNFNFINEELALAGSSVSKLNNRKDKEVRLSYVRRAFAKYLETEPLSKVQYKKDNGKHISRLDETVNYIRKETGLKFSNEEGRKYYREFLGIKQKGERYAPRLPQDKLPRIEKIPKVEGTIKDQYLFGFKLYVRNSGEYLKKLPSKAVRLKQGRYNIQKDFVIWSEVNMSARQIKEYMKQYLLGNRSLSQGFPEYLEGSDYDNVLAKGEDIIGFSYNRLVRT